MSHCETPGCGTPTDLYLCRPHTAAAIALITNAATLAETVTQAKPGNGTGRSTGVAGSQAPCNLDALETAHDLKRALTMIGQRLGATGNLIDYAPRIPTTPGLWMHLAILRTHVQAATRLLDTPQERQLVGTCGLNDCEGQLITTPDSARAWCETCGASWGAAEVRALRAATIHAAHMPLKDALSLLARCGVSLNRNTAKSWVRRGKVQTNEDGHVTLGDMLNARLGDTP